MGLSEVFKQVDFHDSTLVEVKYAPSQATLSVVVDLCNWRQIGYNPQDPEVVSKVLTFTGVSGVNLMPTLPQREPLTHDEILQVQVNPLDQSKGLYAVRIVLAPIRQGSDVAVLEVHASDCSINT